MLGETLPVFSGSFRGIGTLLLKYPLPEGRLVLPGHLVCQQCSDTVCEPPETISFELALMLESFLISERDKELQKKQNPNRMTSAMPLKFFYGCDGCWAIAHTVLIERTRALVSDVIFQCANAAPSRRPHSSAARSRRPPIALIPVPATYGDLGNMAIDHFPVHWIRRLLEAGVYESNDLAAEFCDKGYNLTVCVRRVPPSLLIARRYRLKCRRRISFRIKLGMIFSTFEKGSGNADGIFWNGGADLNFRWVKGVTH